MAIIDDRTAGRNYALPNAANKLKDDVARLRSAAGAVDTDVVAVQTGLAGKASAVHAHAMSEITGLVPALNGKIAVGYHDALDDLSDVSVTGAANGQVLIKQGTQWIPINLQVGNITNLETLLNSKATPADITAAVNGIVGAAPGALDTLIELATALGNDPNFATTMTNALALKAPLASPPLTGVPTAPTAAPGTDTAQLATTAFVTASVFAQQNDYESNLIVNHNFADSAENGDTLGTTNGFYLADQFAHFIAATGAAVSAQRVTVWTPDGSQQMAELKCTTAKTSLGANDFYLLNQNIEGSRKEFRAAKWGTADAKPLMFRTARQLPAGLYHLRVSNQANNRSVAIPFTVSGGQASVLGVIGDRMGVIPPIVIPPCFDGTWLFGSGQLGCSLEIILAAGASQIGGVPRVWGTTPWLATSAQKNFLDSTGNIARFGDLGLKLDRNGTGVYGAYRVGEVDAVYRSERYFEAQNQPSLYLGGGLSGSTQGYGSLTYAFVKSKVPAIATSGFQYYSAGAATNFSPSIAAVNRYFANYTLSGATNWQGWVGSGFWAANARLS